MEKYLCNILHKFSEDSSSDLLKTATRILGFEPKYMTIFFDEFEDSLDDIVYDEAYLFELYKKQPSTITIKNQLYEQEGDEANNWFRFSLSMDSPFGLDTFSLEWSNTDLDFLINSNVFGNFLTSQNLIYCYCYNQFDSINQSNDKIDSFLVNYPNQQYKTVKNFINEDAIDISEHWGKYISTRGMTFMAAPLMWFGGQYFNIICEQDLLEFPGSSVVQFPSFKLVHIKLFELKDDPSKPESREKQELFWKTFNLQNKAEQYEKARPFDFVAWYKERATIKKKKKSRK